MKIYISGKISGLPEDQVQAKFKRAEDYLHSSGHVAVNPLKNGLTAEYTWSDHMIADIQLLIQCDAIYLLEDWLDSGGAVIEKHIADIVGLEVFTEVKERFDQRKRALYNQIFHRVESAIQDVAGVTLTDYAIPAKARDLYFIRMIHTKVCYDEGVKNKSALARRIDRSHCTTARSLELFAEEYKLNRDFRELANLVYNKLHREVIESSL